MESVRVRPMTEGDLDAADRIVRLAFGTYRDLPDPETAFGDADLVRARFRAAPDCAWVAEGENGLLGAVVAARWGSFAFFGPLAVHPEWWDRGVGSRLLEPVLGAFARWDLRQAALFTFSSSAKHLGLYQKHGFWPGSLTVVLGKKVAHATSSFTLFSRDPRPGRLEEIRVLANSVFEGLDLTPEVLSVQSQGLGDTVLVRDNGHLVGMAICHFGPGSEAGSGSCYVKFGAVRPGPAAGDELERLLDACEALADGVGAQRVVAGVSTGRLDAYRRLLRRGFRADLIGVRMRLHPERPDVDTPEHYVLDDLR